MSDEDTDWWLAECSCGHRWTRHDMGHGCIECRCRGFTAAAADRENRTGEGNRDE